MLSRGGILGSRRRSIVVLLPLLLCAAQVLLLQAPCVAAESGARSRTTRVATTASTPAEGAADINNEEGQSESSRWFGWGWKYKPYYYKPYGYGGGYYGSSYYGGHGGGYYGYNYGNNCYYYRSAPGAREARGGSTCAAYLDEKTAEDAAAARQAPREQQKEMVPLRDESCCYPSTCALKESTECSDDGHACCLPGSSWRCE